MKFCQKMNEKSYHQNEQSFERPLHKLTETFLELDFGSLLKGPRERVTPTNKNNAVELSTFEIIARVSFAEVQWQSLALEKLPC